MTVTNIIDNKKPAIKVEIQSLTRLMAANMRSQLVDKINAVVENASIEFENKLMEKLGRINLDILKSPLPVGTRFVVPYKTSVVFVSEQPPQVRSVYLRSGQRATLSFPYVIFAAKIQRNSAGLLHVACRTEPLQSIDDQLYHLSLANIYKGNSGLGICFPYSDFGSDTALESLNKQIKSFWHSAFFGTGNHYSQRGRLLASDWTRKTRKDPAFILKHKFSPATTVRSLCDELAKEQRRGQIKLNESLRKDGITLIRNVGKQLGAM